MPTRFADRDPKIVSFPVLDDIITVLTTQGQIFDSHSLAWLACGCQ